LREKESVDVSEGNRGGILLPILAGAVAGLIGWNVYQFFQIDKLRQEFANAEKARMEDVEALKAASAQGGKRRWPWGRQRRTRSAKWRASRRI
jgi:hypothetical protein